MEDIEPSSSKLSHGVSEGPEAFSSPERCINSHDICRQSCGCIKPCLFNLWFYASVQLLISNIMNLKEEDSTLTGIVHRYINFNFYKNLFNRIINFPSDFIHVLG